jgi:transcriptional regulator with XRE-family HTH domain
VACCLAVVFRTPRKPARWWEPSPWWSRVLDRRLAERAGVTTATVARIERAEIEPCMTTLRKLAQALEVDPAELVGD